MSAQARSVLAALIRRIDAAPTLGVLRGGSVLRLARETVRAAGADLEVPWTPFTRADIPPVTQGQIDGVRRLMGQSEAQARETIEGARRGKLWINLTYQVLVVPWGAWTQLSIKRIDQEPVRDWRDLQRIKNELIGPEYDAVELFPAESRLVDTANQYHLWCSRDPAFRFPFGYFERMVAEGLWENLGAMQRPFGASNER
jgi:hypothetical protein